MKQGTDEWRAARCGKIGASRVADLMATTKSGPSASRKNLIAEIVCERLTGVPAPSYVSPAMQWGTDTEELARASYEALTGNMVDEVGFIEHPTIRMFGASPDGLIDTICGLEIKCPNTATHIEFLTSLKIDRAYMIQMQAGMSCTGRAWWDFVSFDPRLPAALQLRVVRVPRNPAMIAEIEAAVIAALDEIERTVEALRQMEGEK